MRIGAADTLAIHRVPQYSGPGVPTPPRGGRGSQSASPDDFREAGCHAPLSVMPCRSHAIRCGTQDSHFKSLVAQHRQKFSAKLPIGSSALQHGSIALRYGRFDLRKRFSWSLRIFHGDADLYVTLFRCEVRSV